ncbi:MAG TPA: O-antigen ligase family protein [Thermoanaerobaculia bacterium]|nr:O-antigen ligase family protein [Thermoanaerobaculia bacterium]
MPESGNERIRPATAKSGWRERFQSRASSENAAIALLLGYVALAPIPYGEVLPAGMLTLEVLAFAILALTLFGRPRLRRLQGLAVPGAAMIGLAALGLLQLVPIPGPILSLISPASARVYSEASATLSAFGRQSPFPRISIAPTETYDAILLTLAYAALFFASALLLRSRKKRRLFIVVLMSSAIVQVLVATVIRGFFFSPDDPSAGRLHGAFVNANHFAGYLGIALAIAFGALWREVLMSKERGRQYSDRARRFEMRFVYLAAWVLLWGIIAAGIGLTKSRGGILVAAAMTVAMLATALCHRRVRNRRLAFGIAGGAALAAGIGFTALAVKQQPILRFLASDPRDPASDLRITLWRLSLDAWRQFPVAGAGLGAFREGFRRIQPRGLDYLVEYAHSDPLQILVNGGLIGFALAAISLAGLAAALARRWAREERREESAVLLAGLGALASLTLHGFVEFNLSIPAIPATLACVLGLAWSASLASDEEKERERVRLSERIQIVSPIAAGQAGDGGAMSS